MENIRLFAANIRAVSTRPKGKAKIYKKLQSSTYFWVEQSLDIFNDKILEAVKKQKKKIVKRIDDTGAFLNVQRFSNKFSAQKK